MESQFSNLFLVREVDIPSDFIINIQNVTEKKYTRKEEDGTYNRMFEIIYYSKNPKFI